MTRSHCSIAGTIIFITTYIRILRVRMTIVMDVLQIRLLGEIAFMMMSEKEMDHILSRKARHIGHF